MALTNVQRVRVEVADNEPGLYILSDEEIEYLLEKNSNSIARTSLNAARIILLKLAQRVEESVDIFSIKGSKAASEYRQALELFIKDPSLNPLLSNLKGWVGGVSLSEMQTNNDNCDNNVVVSPAENQALYYTGPFNVGWRF